MKILVFGGDGQLGTELTKRSTSECSIIGLDVADGDICNPDAINNALESQKPDYIINAAAYTAVDKAEEEVDNAYAVNEGGVKNVAEAASSFSIPLIHVSTDYVFGGDAERTEPYAEGDPTSPLNKYGSSKLAGDERVLEVYPSGSCIVRTSSVHGAGGHNFVHTMLKLIEEREELRVVQDQVMSPTWAGWLAEVLIKLSQLPEHPTGFLHACTAGAISWYEFAVSIKELATFPAEAKMAQISAIPSSEYPLPATRPNYSVLDCAKLESLLPGVRIDWLEGLKGHLSDLKRLKSG